MRSLIAMMTALKLYTTFETAFLPASREFYDQESLDKLQTTEVGKLYNNCHHRPCHVSSCHVTFVLQIAPYLQHAARRIAQETHRAKVFLQEQTLRPLLQAVDACLLKQHMTTILAESMCSPALPQICNDSTVMQSSRT